MGILVGLAAALALLYFWLIGHWFARVLMFLILAVIGASLSIAAVSGGHPNAFGIILFGLLGAGLTWPIAGLPVYYQRHQSRELDRRVNRVMAVLGAGMPRLPEDH